ncbi:glycoside hydrolase family 31 protein [Phocaeicola fibrisolvens]|uniref:glycoside hydrolase family 31 protein n=1 Tax=Phocaeicola fibrisolvens TaxID=2981793 RepID=UPI000821BE97|nr:TIM-barrel domain-containing protein [Phocaeicola fibrisolvens]MCU6779043.1 DUF5110 domain-containing protein [Phocaeicola fibrisolvens]SCI18701.1 Alpha-xylosidase [uncultured Bacteroides sp.]
MRNSILLLILWEFSTLFISASSVVHSEVSIKEIAPGVISLTLGDVDPYTPFKLLGCKPKSENMQQSAVKTLPFDLSEVVIKQNKRGCSVYVPLKESEQLYGFGLQMGSFTQRGLKKKPIVNDHPLKNLGYTHAPQPFYVSTLGYGILVNTLKYTTFLCGTENELKENGVTIKESNHDKNITSAEDLYTVKSSTKYVYIDVPNTKGVEIFIITGPDLRKVVERYNLLSGGGCLPPLWGLGIKYRTKYDFNQHQVEDIAGYFRDKKLPCDVLGLEPRWQTNSYSCSYVWDTKRFPSYKQFISNMSLKGFKLNLWEHAYVHPNSPIYKPLKPFSGNFLVWSGLVPDFSLADARKIYTDYHQILVDDGIASFKMDECDNSDISSGEGNWGFPDMSEFPSGMDGEQMHQIFGSLYVKMMNELFERNNIRTFQDYRSSGLFMSSVPATLYSDTYDFKQYIQMINNAAFGGLLWSPELRESSSIEELFHRLQLVLLSPQAVLNMWYLDMPSWWQPDKEKNNKGEKLPNVENMEDIVRKLLNQRMSLIPYLYTAFFDYYEKGTPPFRPLVMDYVEDKNVWSIDDQYMIGENMMVAPLYNKGDKRKVYFPKGNWFDFHTGKKYVGGDYYEIETEYSKLPIYVKENSVIPVAKPELYINKNTVFEITCRGYGISNEATFRLIEDDGQSFDYKKNKFNILLLKTNGSKTNWKYIVKNYSDKKYKICKWEFF